MDATAELPWLQDWTAWIKACHCSSSSFLLYTTDMCHDNPRLPNQSVWDSRYLWGRNFIAQSLTIKTVSWSRASIASKRAWSWWADLSRWHFHDWMASTEALTKNRASSLSSCVANDALSTKRKCSEELSAGSHISLRGRERGWALFRGWALIRKNTVLLFLIKPYLKITFKV